MCPSKLLRNLLTDFWGMEVSSFRLMATFLLIINSNKEKFESFTIGEYFITQKTWSKNPVLLHYLWYRIGGINSPVLGHILGPFIIYKLIVPFLGPVFVPVNIYYMPLFSGLLIFIFGPCFRALLLLVIIVPFLPPLFGLNRL